MGQALNVIPGDDIAKNTASHPREGYAYVFNKESTKYSTRNAAGLWDHERQEVPVGLRMLARAPGLCFERTPSDFMYPYVEKYANNGSILDLGCGSGSTGNELTPTTYHHYTGVDISEVAIAKARRRTEENGRGDKNRHFQSDLLEYAPTQQFDVILFRDSIYYVARGKIKAMLYRYSTYLKEGGVFIVRMADGSGEYKQIMDTIENHFEVLGTYSFDRPKAVVMIFRSRCWIESSPDVFQRGAQDH